MNIKRYTERGKVTVWVSFFLSGICQLLTKSMYTLSTTEESSTVKPVLSGHSKTSKTKVLKTDGSLMHVQSIAECSHGIFCSTFDLH